MAIAAIPALSVNGRKNLIGDFQRVMTAAKDRFEKRATALGSTVDHYTVTAIVDDVKSARQRLIDFSARASALSDLVQAYKDDINDQTATPGAWVSTMITSLETVRDDARMLRDSKSPIAYDASDNQVAATFSAGETADLKLSLERLAQAINTTS